MARVFKLNIEETSSQFCYVTTHSPYGLALMEGDPVLKEMNEARVKFLDFEIDEDEDEGGREPPDRIGNTDNILLLKHRCYEWIINNYDLGDCEVIPARIIEDGTVLADDYVVLNPLGQVDCLDSEKSDMDGDEDDPGVQIFGNFWLKADSIPKDQPIFRVRGMGDLFFTEILSELINQKNFTNFSLEPVALSCRSQS